VPFLARASSQVRPSLTSCATSRASIEYVCASNRASAMKRCTQSTVIAIGTAVTTRPRSGRRARRPSHQSRLQAKTLIVFQTPRPR
jgi:hypothetical protein